MYILPTRYAKIFQEIKKTSLSHSTCKLIIFVSCLNIDSMCSARILCNIFKKELIHYQLIPVVGYSEMKKHFGKLDSEIVNVILIGCGAMLDVESFFEMTNDAPSEDDTVKDQEVQLGEFGKPSRKVYIIDGHRPWNLDNIFGSAMVVCFDEGHVESNLTKERIAYKKFQDYEGLEEEPDSEGDSDLDFSHGSDREDLGEERDENELENRSDSFEANTEKYDDDNESGDQMSSNKKRRLEVSKARKLKRQRRKELDESENIIESYYNQGTTIGTSTTAVVYALLSSIGETNLDNLWLAIIGTSSLDSYYPEVYDRIDPLFKQEVYRLNPSVSNGITKTADSNELIIDKDYRLFLLRHWTLYDSFFYSSQVNSKLNLWTEGGRKKLHKLFAKMGVSLSIAQQKWLYMDINVKKQLPSIFKKYLPLYGLEGIVRDGFIRTFGYIGQLSAIECVESLTALLECDRNTIMNAFGGSENEQDNTVSQDEKVSTEIEKKEKIWINNFWSSWDALNMKTESANNTNTLSNSSKKLKGLDLMIMGLEQAKKIQQVIFRTGMSLLERKMIRNLRLYRLCVLNDGSIPDLNVFRNPLILTKLGTWLLENITELEFLNSSNSISLKPLVIASLDSLSDTYLVIGLVPKYPRGLDSSAKAKLQQDEDHVVRLNTFSVAFQEVANTSGAKVRIDSFESSAIEVRKDDLSPFLEKLTLSGLI